MYKRAGGCCSTTKKGMKKILALLFSTVLLFSVIIGCGSSKQADTMARETPASHAAFNSGSETDYKDTEREVFKGESQSQYSDESSGSKDNVKKIIKNGEIAVEVKDVEDSYKKILEILKGIGGEEFNKSFSIYGEFKRMELVLKIPPENLDLFEEELKKCVGEGKIKSSSIRSQDITSEYYDFSARLESYQASRDQLKELLKKAETVEDTLKIHGELTRLQAEIDSMQGQIKMWDKLVGMATITLYIDEEANPLKKTTTVGWKFNSPSDIWKTMKNGFISVVNWLYSLIVWVIISIVSITPLLIIAAIVLYIVLNRRKKKKKDITKT